MQRLWKHFKYNHRITLD